MWSPTHIEVTILRARNLLTKGKNDTNNCFVTISMDKEKFQTSIKDKAQPNLSWEEACELKIPDQGNRAELVLTVLHRNSYGLDDFLGQVTLPLNTMDVYDRPRPRWFKLESKPGHEKKNKERGELEVRIGFIVKSGSLTDLSKKGKHKSSIGQLANSVGGSLLSIGAIEKRKTIKNFAKSLGSKMHLHSKKKNKDGDEGSFNGSFQSIDTHYENADPGVRDDDEFAFDNLSHKSSDSSLNIRSGFPRVSPRLGNSKLIGKLNLKQPEADIIDPELEQIENDFSLRARTLPPPSKPPRTQTTLTEDSEEKTMDEWESKLVGNHLGIGSVNSLKRRSWEQNPLPSTAEETTTAAVKEASETSSSSEDEEEEEEKQVEQTEAKAEVESAQQATEVAKPSMHLLTPEDELKGFQHFNESFSKFEKSAKIQEDTKAFLEQESKSSTPAKPAVLPRQRIQPVEPTPEPKREQKVEEPLEKPLQQVAEETEQQRKEAKRREEDQRLLNFAKRSISGESDANSASTPEQSPKERGVEKRDKRLNKFKYFKRDKNEEDKSSAGSPKSTERIIIGHEKSTTHAERRSEISAALSKKYEGKSRDELMLIANGMENEALIQRQRVKELEDYLDNLLLRVMETHPKILQNPYSRTTSAKSG